MTQNYKRSVLRARSVAFLELLAGTAWAGSVATWQRRLVPDGRVLQIITADKSPVAVLAFEQTLLTMPVVFAVLSEMRLERDERFVLVDLFRIEDFESTPGRCFGPLTNERQIDVLTRM